MASSKTSSHFAELLDFLPDVLAWVKDRQGRYLWVNRTTRATGPSNSVETTGHGFGPALAHMRAHFHQEITNQHLASISNMSLRAFERQFGAAFHVTPQKFLRKLRLRIASRALIDTDEPLSEIALKCGFADQSHFSREFRLQFGRTPRDYRGHYKL